VSESPGLPLYGWPGLHFEEGTVNVRLFRSQDAARSASIHGVQRLVEIAIEKDLAWIEKDLREKADEAGTDLFRVACKMATGSGKTVVMSMLVAWQVPVQALSEAEYKALLEKHGFSKVQARRIPDRSPSPEIYSGKWFKNAEELRDFKSIGALLLIGEKR
jgi:hypothetical protein